MGRSMTKLLYILFVFLTFASVFHSFFTTYPHQCLTQSNFALKALKFDPSNFIEVAIAKPFGMSLEVLLHCINYIKQTNYVYTKTF